MKFSNIFKFVVLVTSVISICAFSACSSNSSREVAQESKSEFNNSDLEFSVDSMTCSGTQVGASKEKANPNSAFVALRLESYLSQKNLKDNGNKVYAHTLRIQEDYAANEAEAQKYLNPEKETPSKYDSANYDTPLVFDNNGHVVNGVDSDFGPFDLQMISSSLDQTALRGTYGYVKNDHGFGYYNINCQAKVIPDPTRVIDKTNICRRLAGEAVLKELETKKLDCTATARSDYAHNKMSTFFVSTRCDNHKGYSYTVLTTPSKDKKSCTLGNVIQTGSRNLHK